MSKMYRCKITQRSWRSYSSTVKIMTTYVCADNFVDAIERHATVVSGDEYYSKYLVTNPYMTQPISHEEFNDIADSKYNIKEGVDFIIDNLTINIKSINDSTIESDRYGHSE